MNKANRSNPLLGEAELSKIILAPLPGCDSPVDSKPRVSHKTLHPGLSSVQPFGLATPEACKYISPGYAFFACPGKGLRENCTPKVVRGVASLLAVHFRLFPIPILDTSGL